MRTDTPVPPTPGGMAATPPRSQPAASTFDEWIEEARAGSSVALGRLLEATRKQMLLSANQALDPNLKIKVAASDLVQETFALAKRDFERFQGTSQRELYAWLTVILAHRVANSVRHYRGSQKRAIDREASIEAMQEGVNQVPDRADTPGTAALAREEELRVRTAMQQLNASDREILIERTWQRLPFAEIGQRRGCSADAARKLWGRAVERLKILLKPTA
jgi:RNA polymerase sigma-70 factor, ECF subfamily